MGDSERGSVASKPTLERGRKQAWSWKDGDPAKRERQELYLDWLLTPTAEREPKTKRELAERLGVTPQTLRNYAREAWFQHEIDARGRKLSKVERAPEVLESLLNQALDHSSPRSVSAARTWLEYVFKDVASSPQEQVLNEMSDEELLELAASLAKDRLG